MDTIKKLFTVTCSLYNKQQSHYASCNELVQACHRKLFAETKYAYFGDYKGSPILPYHVFGLTIKNLTVYSRPVRPDIFIADIDELVRSQNAFTSLLEKHPASWEAAEIELSNKVVYTSVMSISCAYDLWQRGSRKTPGTFFEVLMAGILKKMLPDAIFSKSIPLANLLHDEELNEANSDSGQDIQNEDDATGLSTDLVIALPDLPGGVVIPLKITTRERIVQPFAHQRILNSAFPDGRFQSVLVCISETQLDEKNKAVKQVTVPGTVQLFQKYLAKLNGIYYCDIPQRYAADSMQKIVPVKSVGQLFADLAKILLTHSTRK